MISVKATREGLTGAKTATGYVVDPYVPFVALPSNAALRLWIRLYNPSTKKSCNALVMDVGPWNETDHKYVFQDATLNKSGSLSVLGVTRPASEKGIDTRGRATNGSGIDLGETVWAKLGMTDNSNVWWEFM